MGALIDDITDHLLAEALVDYEIMPSDATTPRLGWGCSRGVMPAAPDAVITIGEYAGNPPTVRTDRDEPGLQIRIRGLVGTYQATRAKIEAIRVALHGLGARIVGSSYYVEIDATGSVMPLGDDQRGRPEFSANFIASRSR